MKLLTESNIKSVINKIITLLSNKVDKSTYNSDKDSYALKSEVPTNLTDLTANLSDDKYLIKVNNGASINVEYAERDSDDYTDVKIDDEEIRFSHYLGNVNSPSFSAIDSDGLVILKREIGKPELHMQIMADSIEKEVGDNDYISVVWEDTLETALSKVSGIIIGKSEINQNSVSVTSDDSQKMATLEHGKVDLTEYSNATYNKDILTEISCEKVTLKTYDQAQDTIKSVKWTDIVTTSDLADYTKASSFKTINQQSIVGDGDITIDLNIFKVVAKLPTEHIDSNKIYLVPSSHSTEQNVYDEYSYTNGNWEKLGSYASNVNLTEYVKTSDLPDTSSLQYISTEDNELTLTSPANDSSTLLLGDAIMTVTIEDASQKYEFDGSGDITYGNQEKSVIWTTDLATTTTAGIMSATDKSKLNNIQNYTIGEGLTVENGTLKCSFTPTKYYTGSTAPNNSLGNNGDLYMLIS